MLFSKIRNDQDKLKVIEQIQKRTMVSSNFVFEEKTPLTESPMDNTPSPFKSKKTTDEFQLKAQISRRIQKMQDSKTSKQGPEYLDIERQQKIKEHISQYKIKSSFEWIMAKHYLNIWREETFRTKLLNDQKKELDNNVKDQQSMIADQLLKNEIYNQTLKKKSTIKNSFPDIKSKQSKKSKISEQPHEEIKNQSDKAQLFQMPNKDLLKYIPYCTDVYLGND